MSFYHQLIKRGFHMTKNRYFSQRVDFTFSKRRQKYDPYYDASVYGKKPRTKLGGRYEVPIVKGSHAGPEMMDAVIEVFSCANAPVNFLQYDLTPETTDAEFKDFMLSVRRCGVVIKSFIERPSESDNQVSHHLSRNMFLRNELRLYVNKMHLKSLPGLPTKGEKIDVILVRQNTEGEYTLLEHMPVKGMVESLKIVTRVTTELLAKYTFELAKRENRRRVTCLYLQGGTPYFFLEIIMKVAEKYPDIEFKIQSTTTAMQDIMAEPEEMDVIIAESLYGGVIANCIFGLLGSPGITAGCNYGKRYAMFEPAARSRGRSLAGKNIVNPTAALLAGVEMLKYLEAYHEANLIEDAVLTTLECDKVFTPDLGGNATTHDFVLNVVERIKENSNKISYCSYDQPPPLPPLPKEPTPPYDPSYHEGLMKMNENVDGDDEDTCGEDDDD